MFFGVFLELFNLTYLNLPENLFSHTDFQGTSAYTHFEGGFIGYLRFLKNIKNKRFTYFYKNINLKS